VDQFDQLHVTDLAQRQFSLSLSLSLSLYLSLFLIFSPLSVLKKYEDYDFIMLPF
jgi:hypothetical protein